MEAEVESVSLEQVRVQFLQAEEHLRRLATSIEEAKAVATELGASRESVAQAAESLASLADQIGGAANTFSDHDASLRRGIELLAAADPAAIREDIALLRSIAADSRESTSADLQGLAGRAEAHQSVLTEVKRDVRIAIGAASAALVVAIGHSLLTLI